MAQFNSEWPSNKPDTNSEASITLRGESLFVGSSYKDSWLLFKLTERERRSLLKVLLKDFIDGILQ